MTIFDKNVVDLVMILLVTFWFIPFGAFMALLQHYFPEWFKRKPGGSDVAMTIRMRDVVVNGLVLGHLFGVTALIIYSPLDGPSQALLWVASGAAVAWAAIQIHIHWCDKPVTPDATQPELPF